jgi:hypothetical protein
MEPRKRRGRKRRDSACRARSRPRDSFGNIRALLSCKTTDAAMACSSSCKKMKKTAKIFCASRDRLLVELVEKHSN